MISKIKGKIREWLFRCVRLSERDIKEFEKKFPDKCMICSFHRFGYEMGYLPTRESKVHKCKEAE